MKSLLIDTNVLISLFRGDENIAAEIGAYDRVLVPTVVIGEFKAGINAAVKAGKAQQRQLDEFLDSAAVSVIPVSEDVSDAYARIFRVLKANGTPIPQNDMWIAACAVETGATLYTKDAHFSLIPLLKVIVAG